MKKILAFTSSRSDYDLLSYLYKLLNEDKNIDLRIMVSGAHLSPAYGMTVKNIEQDGLKILDRIETLLDSDTDSARIKSAAILMQGAIHSVKRFSPDLIIYAGDREDVIIAALLGGYLKIPTAHFFAGDHDCDGLIDNPVRHAASRLSAYKFVSLEEHKNRLLRMGEVAQRIFCIGSCALDKFKHEPILTKGQVFEKLTGGGEPFKKYALVIFHPLMDYEHRTVSDFNNILNSLKSLGVPAVVNLPNIDAGSRALIKRIEELCQDKDFLIVKGLERNIFINVYRNAAFQVGNSSSGILEAASIPIPAINIGKRMLGRKAQKNVIFSSSEVTDIKEAIRKALSDDFIKKNLKGLKNIYGDGNSCRRAYNIIKHLKLADFAEFRKVDPLGAIR
ncbi:MAG: UDP-N-acetylglucosamine 2-epimerase (hydrolyzing) [Candidatus Omnitrophica bacterium]|nr:UDP-N-acetylglucosamine 2-epimerase (hydrolyzing) [Candidatus Omnitrophota bacterium]